MTDDNFLKLSFVPAFAFGAILAVFGSLKLGITNGIGLGLIPILAWFLLLALLPCDYEDNNKC